MGDLIHTKIGPALKDPTCWLALVAGFTGASVLPVPFNFLTALACVPAALLKGGQPTPGQPTPGK